MKATEFITYMIQRLPKGHVFTYEDFITPESSKESIVKVLKKVSHTLNMYLQDLFFYKTHSLLHVVNKFNYVQLILIDAVR